MVYILVARTSIEIERKVIELYQCGTPVIEIIKIVNLSKATIWHIFERYNIDLHHPNNARRPSHHDIEKMIEMYNKGEPVSVIEKTLNSTHDTIIKYLSKNGITIVRRWAERRNTCHICKVTLTEENYDRAFKRCDNRTCKKCGSFIRTSTRRKLKYLIVLKYGGKCECCGIDDIEFLTIDHTNNDGNNHRKELKQKKQTLYAWLKRNNFPDGFRVLCFNCNCSRGAYGYCPHEKLTDKIPIFQIRNYGK